MICIECPKGCQLTVSSNEKGEISVQGNECKKGARYGIEEATHPVRILTSTIRTSGLSVAMLPVRTDKAIPKSRLFEGMEEIRLIQVNKPVQAGEILKPNFLGIEGVNLIATRSIE
ncbi:MAG: DUF1667 domain-containing protein [bacterium]